MMKSIITCDLEGVIETINSDGEKLFGYKKEELVWKKRVSLFSAGEVVIQNVGMWLSQANKYGEYSTKTFFINKEGKKLVSERINNVRLSNHSIRENYVIAINKDN